MFLALAQLRLRLATLSRRCKLIQRLVFCGGPVWAPLCWDLDRMGVARIVRHFEALSQVPVSITDIVTQVALEVPDEVIKVRALDEPYTELRGLVYRRKLDDDTTYMVPIYESTVVYSSRMPLPWQRLACTKELLHIVDPEPLCTSTCAEVVKLADNMANNKKVRHSELAGLQTLADNLGRWQAVAALFPFRAVRRSVSAFQSWIFKDRNGSRVDAAANRCVRRGNVAVMGSFSRDNSRVCIEISVIKRGETRWFDVATLVERSRPRRRRTAWRQSSALRIDLRALRRRLKLRSIVAVPVDQHLSTIGRDAVLLRQLPRLVELRRCDVGWRVPLRLVVRHVIPPQNFDARARPA